LKISTKGVGTLQLYSWELLWWDTESMSERMGSGENLGQRSSRKPKPMHLAFKPRRY
jgi:hypothetical protein